MPGHLDAERGARKEKIKGVAYQSYLEGVGTSVLRRCFVCLEGSERICLWWEHWRLRAATPSGTLLEWSVEVEHPTGRAG